MHSLFFTSDGLGSSLHVFCLATQSHQNRQIKHPVLLIAPRLLANEHFSNANASGNGNASKGTIVPSFDREAFQILLQPIKHEIKIVSNTFHWKLTSYIHARSRSPGGGSGGAGERSIAPGA